MSERNVFLELDEMKKDLSEIRGILKQMQFLIENHCHAPNGKPSLEIDKI